MMGIFTDSQNRVFVLPADIKLLCVNYTEKNIMRSALINRKVN